MVGVLAIIAAVWFVRQFYGHRPAKWRVRSTALLPVWIVFSGDVRAATRPLAHPLEVRRASRGLDDEWADLTRRPDDGLGRVRS